MKSDILKKTISIQLIAVFSLYPAYAQPNTSLLAQASQAISQLLCNLNFDSFCPSTPKVELIITQPPTTTQQTQTKQSSQPTPKVIVQKEKIYLQPITKTITKIIPQQTNNQELNQIKNKLTQLESQLKSQQHFQSTQTRTIYKMISQSQIIDTLDNVDITNSTINSTPIGQTSPDKATFTQLTVTQNATLANTHLTGQTTIDSLNVSNSTTTNQHIQNLTANNATTTGNQSILGNLSVGGNTNLENTNINGNLNVSGTTNLSTTTISNLQSTNATFTNSTSTNFFANTLSAISATISNTLTALKGIFTNLEATNATTTNLTTQTLKADTIKTTFQQGSVIFANANNELAEDNSNLFWDETNKRLGVGTTIPATRLDVKGRISLHSEQMMYNANADGFLRSLFFGNGGTNLSHTTGDEGYNNTGIGYNALLVNTIGFNNTAVGVNALKSNVDGNRNVALGYRALELNISGFGNTALGVSALAANTSGGRNVAIGHLSMADNISGRENIGIGYSTLRSNTIGNYNVAIGRQALGLSVDGIHNVALGYRAGQYIADGSTANSTGDYNVLLGSQTKLLSDNDQNEIVIGYNATGNGSNSVTLGNDNIIKTILKGNVGIGTTNPSEKLEIKGGNLSILSGDSTKFATIYGKEGGNYGSLKLTGRDDKQPFIEIIGHDSHYNLGTETSGMIKIRSGSGYGGYKGIITFENWDGSSVVERMRLDGATGNLGLGTTNPTSRLHVNDGDVQFNDASDNPGFFFDESTGRVGIGTVSPDDALHINGGKIRITSPNGVYNSTLETTDAYTTLIQTPVDFEVQNGSGGSLLLGYMSWSKRINMDDTGLYTASSDFGIYAGHQAALGFLTHGSTAAYPAIQHIYTDNNNSGIAFYSRSSGSNVERMRITNTGNVGIGTTNPQAKLHVSGGGILIDEGKSLSFRRLSDGAIRRLIGTSAAGGGSYYLNIGYNSGIINDIRFENGSGIPMVIKNTGNVGIGTTNPQAKLDVNGDINISDTSKGYSIGGVRMFYASSTNASIMLGQNAGASLLADGRDNIAIGMHALRYATSTDQNIAIGTYSLARNNGTANVAIGYYSMISNTTGSQNVAIGARSLYDNTTGNSNIAIGIYSLPRNSTGSQNIALGYATLGLNTSGLENVAIGGLALYGNTTGSKNVSVGAYSGGVSSSKPRQVSGSVFVGNAAGYNVATSSGNVFIGYRAGYNVTTGSNNIIIGANVDAPDPVGHYQLNIGNTIYGNLSAGSVGIGITTPADKLQVFGDIRVGTSGTNGCVKNFAGTGIAGTCSSDERLKTNIKEIQNLLKGFENINVVNFNWNKLAKELYNNDTTTNQIGVIAQDIQKAFPELVVEDSKGYKQVNYTGLSIYSLGAIKELNQKLESIAEEEKEEEPVSFKDRFFAKLIQWFSSSTNKIKSIFVKEKICVDGECLTAEDIRKLKQQLSQSNTNSNSDSDTNPNISQDSQPQDEDNNAQNNEQTQDSNEQTQTNQNPTSTTTSTTTSTETYATTSATTTNNIQDNTTDNPQDAQPTATSTTSTTTATQDLTQSQQDQDETQQIQPDSNNSDTTQDTQEESIEQNQANNQYNSQSSNPEPTPQDSLTQDNQQQNEQSSSDEQNQQLQFDQGITSQDDQNQQDTQSQDTQQ